MKPYANHSGESGVEAYEITPTSVRVKFRHSERIYEYSERSAGVTSVRRMKRLAESGKGLSTFITRYVHDRYER